MGSSSLALAAVSGTSTSNPSIVARETLPAWAAPRTEHQARRKKADAGCVGRGIGSRARYGAAGAAGGPHGVGGAGWEPAARPAGWQPSPFDDDQVRED